MRRFAAWAVLSLLALPGALPGEKKTKEPFYRQFLVPGDPLDEAILVQERRLEEDPDNAGLHNDMGVLLARRRLPEMAEDEFRRAMKLDKKNWLAPYNLGLVLESEGKLDGAKKAYKASIDRNPGIPHSLFRLGRLYERTGYLNDAIAQYSAALRIDPSMRNPEVNPLVLDSSLMDRVSLTNYVYDASRRGLASDVVYAEPERFRPPPPVDRPIATDELIDPPAPPTVPIRISSEPDFPQPQAEMTPPPPALTPVPEASGAPTAFPRPRTTRAPLSPDAFLGRPTPPPAPEPEEAPEPEPEPTAAPSPD